MTECLHQNFISALKVIKLSQDQEGQDGEEYKSVQNSSDDGFSEE